MENQRKSSKCKVRRKKIFPANIWAESFLKLHFNCISQFFLRSFNFKTRGNFSTKKKVVKPHVDKNLEKCSLTSENILSQPNSCSTNFNENVSKNHVKIYRILYMYILLLIQLCSLYLFLPQFAPFYKTLIMKFYFKRVLY